MNCGTSRGNAPGFKLDTLGKLKAMKATNETKISLMQYLVQFVGGKEPEAMLMDTKYSSLAEALRLSFDQIGGDLDKMFAKLGAIEREVAQGLNEDESKGWSEKMSTFVGRAKVEIQKNRDALKEVTQKISDIMKRYALDPSVTSDSGKSAQEEFLMLFHDFVEDWKRAREDNVRAARMMEKLKEREAKKLKLQQEKEEKTKRLMAMGSKNKNLAAAQVDDVMAELKRTGSFQIKKK